MQATARDILCYAVRTLRCCSIVMHIHDELVIEADPRMSLDAVCEQMGRTPPWAKGLLLRADGYATPFYKRLIIIRSNQAFTFSGKQRWTPFSMSARKGGIAA